MNKYARLKYSGLRLGPGRTLFTVPFESTFRAKEDVLSPVAKRWRGGAAGRDEQEEAIKEHFIVIWPRVKCRHSGL